MTTIQKTLMLSVFVWIECVMISEYSCLTWKTSAAQQTASERPLGNWRVLNLLHYRIKAQEIAILDKTLKGTWKGMTVHCLMRLTVLSWDSQYNCVLNANGSQAISHANFTMTPHWFASGAESLGCQISWPVLYVYFQTHLSGKQAASEIHLPIVSLAHCFTCPSNNQVDKKLISQLAPYSHTSDNSSRS